MAKELFINIPDKSKQGFHKIAYTQWGDESNPKVLICVHGLSRNGRDFDYLAQVMQKTHRVIAIDVAGRGKSQWLEDKSQYNYFTYNSDILYLLSSLNITKVDWVGTSMGGIIAMLIGAFNPLLINRLVLNDIGAFIPGVALERIFTYVGHSPKFENRKTAELMLKSRMSTFGIDSDAQWQHIFDNSIIQLPDGSFTLAYDPQIIRKPSFMQKLLGFNIKKPDRWFKMPDVNLWPYWNKITSPTLIIRGGESDILDKQTAEKMIKGRNNSKLVELRGIGHAPMLMDEKQVELVQSWLNNNGQ